MRATRTVRFVLISWQNGANLSYQSDGAVTNPNAINVNSFETIEVCSKFSFVTFLHQLNKPTAVTF